MDEHVQHTPMGKYYTILWKKLCVFFVFLMHTLFTIII